tara:strand:+ start:575 stop:1048 length:474 start_codon:yes stop_codon:yes gene_type:complete
MNHLEYRQAAISDIPEIVALMRRSKSHFHKNETQYVNIFIETWGPGAYYIEDHILYMALNNHELIGIIGMREPNSNRKFAELDLLFVESKYIGKGYGRLLWNKSVSLAKERGLKSFRFVSDNLPQIKGFYEHMGANTIDEIHLQAGNFPFMEYLLDK